MEVKSQIKNRNHVIGIIDWSSSERWVEYIKISLRSLKIRGANSLSGITEYIIGLGRKIKRWKLTATLVNGWF